MRVLVLGGPGSVGLSFSERLMQPCTPWLAVPPLDGSTRRERVVRKGALAVDAEPLELWVRQTDWANQEVAGESHYTDALRSLVGSVPRAGIDAWTEARLLPEANNKHDPNAVAVVCSDRIVGYLPREDAARYAGPLSALVAAGWAPTTRARIWVGYAESWDDRRRTAKSIIGSVRLCLPEPHLLAPVTSSPDGPYVLLPVGAAIQVTGEEKHLAALLPWLPDEGECWVHATLHDLVETGPRTTKRVVEVRVVGSRVGQLTPKMSGELLPAIDHLAGRGAVTVARAMVRGNRLKADVVLYCQRSGELAPQWFDEPIRRGIAESVGRSAAGLQKQSEPAATAAPSAAQLPGPGWYSDPYSEAHWRWWDGSVWTVHQALK